MRASFSLPRYINVSVCLYVYVCMWQNYTVAVVTAAAAAAFRAFFYPLYTRVAAFARRLTKSEIRQRRTTFYATNGGIKVFRGIPVCDL